MALVDAKQRFMWASSGFPGNSHDAMIFQSTCLYAEKEEGKIMNQVAKVQDGQHLPNDHWWLCFSFQDLVSETIY